LLTELFHLNGCRLYRTGHWLAFCGHVVVMRPGSDPIQGLKDGITDAAKVLGLNGAEQSQLRGRLNISDPGESAYALRCDLDRKKTETLLIIDQFEACLSGWLTMMLGVT
jgi:hypothetical protein